MKLSEILKNVPCELSGFECDITSVEYDSRKVTPGSLFVAICGYETDGHLYVKNAVENGAAAILAQNKVEAPVPVIYTEDTRQGLALAGAAFYGNSADRLKIIGVTGTNGKTTVTYLVKKILELKGIKAGIIGTNQNIVGNEVLEAGRTTPESLDLHELFKRMEDAGATHVIMEVSSHALALSRTYGIDFEVGAFTNLTQDHLDFHKTFEEYYKAKAKLFSQCKKGAVNIDDSYGERMAQDSKAPVLTYGISDKADIRAENIKLSERGVIFDVNYGGKTHEVRLGIPGKFSVYNALTAITICLQLGIDFEDIVKGLILAKGVKGRAEVVPLSAPYTVIIDYAHTPDGLENIINTVRGFAKGRVVTLFGCGGDRDKTKRPIMGDIAGTLSDFCVVTSDNPRTENPSLIIKDVLEGMKKFEGKYVAIEDRTEAIKYAMENAKEGDVIILAGKGHETYQIVKSGKIDYDERVIVKSIFEGMK
ncbi:MAG: UDP-N-acetylmuramoyl-L-alanyl-D-glutamate--2,6-diaminopimelate ligase [Clostridia bacterium]|nr:UDP-N-acetylmuramoyl-L-alanyl-D-glutamate--2,6-diaminopimelate ligase [Clostridia bacterium]